MKIGLKDHLSSSPLRVTNGSRQTWNKKHIHDSRRYTVFYVISAPGAFEIRVEEVLLFLSIFHHFLKKLQTSLSILCYLQSQKERGDALIAQNTVKASFLHTSR